MPVVADVNWANVKNCKGGFIVHGICIMTSTDLPNVQIKVDVNDLSGPLFHNKYFMERDHTVMDCVEKQLVIRNRLEFENDC